MSERYNIPDRLVSGQGSRAHEVDLEEQEMDKLVIEIEALLKTLIEKAIETASEYATAAGRDMVTGTDVIYSMQYQGFHFFNSPDLNEKVKYWKENPEGSESESSENDVTSGSGSEMSASLDLTENEEHFTSAPDSAGDIIAEINRCHNVWDAWEPTTVQQQMLKRAVDRCISEFI
jgi:hypothetical protein